MGYFRHSFLEFIRHYFCLLPFCQNRDKTMDFIYFSLLLLFFDLCSRRCFFFFYVQPADRSGICYCGSCFLLYAKVSGKEELENSAHLFWDFCSIALEHIRPLSVYIYRQLQHFAFCVSFQVIATE